MYDKKRKFKLFSKWLVYVKFNYATKKKLHSTEIIQLNLKEKFNNVF